MAIKIELKRSAVPGKVPSTSSLDLGEVAINTFDGKAYFKKNDGTQKIVQLADVSGSIASASFATTASYALNSQNIDTGSIVSTSSFNAYTSSINSYTSSLNSTTSSFVRNSQTSSMSVASASFAATSSFASNFTVANTLTAQTLVVQTISSSIIYSSGSNIFGNSLNNTQVFTGSVTVTGSLTVNNSNVILINQTSSMSVLSASYAATASHVLNSNTSQISTGSITASVDVSPNNLFLIKSGSNVYFNISSSSNTTLSSDLFIIKNFTTQQPVLTISQSVVQFATQSTIPTGTTQAGSIWFTSSSFYVGLE